MLFDSWNKKSHNFHFVLLFSPLRFTVLQDSCRCSTDGSVSEALLVWSRWVWHLGYTVWDTSWIIHYSTGINCKVNWLVWLSEAAVFLFVSAWMLMCPNDRLSAALWLYILVLVYIPLLNVCKWLNWFMMFLFTTRNNEHKNIYFTLFIFC